MPRGGQSIMVSGWNDVDFDCTLGGSNSDNFFLLIFPFDSFFFFSPSFGMFAGHTEMVDYLHKAMTDHDDAQRKAHADRWEQNDKTNEEEGLKHREKMKNPCTSNCSLLPFCPHDIYIFFLPILLTFFFSRV